MSGNNPDLRVNIVLVGESGVGKSCLMHHYLYGEFLPRTQTTIGANMNVKNVDFLNKKVNVRLWDPAGTERYHCVLPSLFRDAHGAIIVYDVGTQSSFNNLEYWLQKIEEHSKGNVCKILVANKIDEFHRCITKEEGKQRAAALNVPYMETSAKDGDNVEAVFEYMLFKVLQNPDLVPVPNNGTVNLSEAEEEDTRPWYERWC